MRAAREANAAMPEYTVGLLAGAYGDLTGARWPCSAPPTAAG